MDTGPVPTGVKPLALRSHSLRSDASMMVPRPPDATWMKLCPIGSQLFGEPPYAKRIPHHPGALQPLSAREKYFDTVYPRGSAVPSVEAPVGVGDDGVLVEDTVLRVRVPAVIAGGAGDAVSKGVGEHHRVEDVVVCVRRGET